MKTPERICIFEDEGAADFLPLSWTRPVYDLRCGAMTLSERIRKFFPGAQVFLQCRPHLTGVVAETHPGTIVARTPPESCLFINGRVLYTQALHDQLLSDERLELTRGASRVAFWNSLTPNRMESNAVLFQYPWDLVSHNAEVLRSDFFETFQLGQIHEGVYRVNPDRIAIGHHSVIKPGVVLDAEHGPIMIGDHVVVMANAYIEGPVHIGSHSLIKAGAKIYGGTTIGPTCKVGGEVEGSILHGFSNKQHDGFLGHSYIGAWCNLGADTNTSDLKNNYSSVRVTLRDREVDTHQLFVGLFMGDHSKSGINTMFNTGTTVGVSCNVFGGGFPPKSIPSFSWVNGEDVTTYDLEKAIDVARVVMQRRNQAMTETSRRVLEFIYGETSGDRSPTT